MEDLAESEVRSLADIIKFSEEHPELEFFDRKFRPFDGLNSDLIISLINTPKTECPNQQSLIDNLNKSLPLEIVSQALKAMRKEAGTEGLGKAIDESDLDVLVAPTDSPISTVAALAGMFQHFA